MAVQPKPLRLLVYLVTHRDRVVPKDELLDALWPRESVVPEVLTTAVRNLRRALGDDARAPRFVRTVRAAGYRFIATARETPAPSGAGSPTRRARHARFVGRDRELEHVQASLLAPDATLQLLIVHGPPGIGKTTLLQEIEYQARRRDVVVHRCGADRIRPLPDAFADALGPALAPAGEGRLRLVLLDDWDHLAALEEWLRESLLPDLPAHVRLVLASRAAPSARWRADPAFGSTVGAVGLAPFDAEETRRYLQRSAVPPEHHTALFEYTGGLPLALAVAAEAISRGAPAATADRAPVVEALVERLLDRVPGGGYLHALQAAALTPVLDERLLHALTARPDVETLFAWLAERSFVERTPDGLRMHALAREAIVEQLRWRNPARLHRLFERGMAFYLEEMERVDRPEDRVVLSALALGMGRHHPLLRPMYRDDAARALRVRTARPEDLPRLPPIVARHEGERSARILERWLARQPEHAWVVWDAAPEPAGFVLPLFLGARDRDACRWDPAIDAMFRHLDATGGIGDDEVVLLHRYIVDRDGYQAVSGVMQRCHEIVNHNHHWYPYKQPELTHTYLVYGEPDVWDGTRRFAGCERLDAHAFAMGGRQCVLTHFSFARTPVDRWVADVVRELSTAAWDAAPAPAGGS